MQIQSHIVKGTVIPGYREDVQGFLNLSYQYGKENLQTLSIANSRIIQLRLPIYFGKSNLFILSVLLFLYILNVYLCICGTSISLERLFSKAG